MSRLFLSIPMTLLALSGQAEPTLSECQARATRVVQQLDAQADAPLSREEARLAYSAALASCRGEYAPPASAPAEPEAPAAEKQGSRFDRFVKGLLAMDTQIARKRPGGKARYLEKD
jgi:hypothetical protein